MKGVGKNMEDYLILKLNNSKECILIDIIECNNKKYFFVVDNLKKLHNHKEMINVYNFNEDKNSIEKIIDENEKKLVFVLFEKRLKYENDVFDNFKKMKVIDLKNNNYVLEDNNGVIKSKNLNFLINDIPKIGDYIFMNDKIVDEINIFEYGNIYDFSKITENEIIKIKTTKNEYFLQRYYG